MLTNIVWALTTFAIPILATLVLVVSIPTIAAAFNYIASRKDDFWLGVAHRAVWSRYPGLASGEARKRTLRIVANSLGIVLTDSQFEFLAICDPFPPKGTKTPDFEAH